MNYSKKTKEDLVIEIAQLLRVTPPRMSTGSTEPKELFIIIEEVLALGLDLSKSKPEIARKIVESVGISWDPNCESRGSTVTHRGLSKVLEAITFFLKS
jgi:hypothetical protein